MAPKLGTVGLLGLTLFAAACGAQSQANDRSSGATNWLSCATDADCPDTGSCDDQDYCIDANGERLEAEPPANTETEPEPVASSPAEPELVASSSVEPEPAASSEPEPGVALCEALSAPEPTTGSDVQITVTNRRDVTVGVGSTVGCGAAILQVESLDPEAPGSWSGSSCLSTCEQMLSGAVGCDPSCPSSPVVVLAPGESGMLSWAGLLGAQQAFPQECCPTSGYCGAECTIIREATSGSYRGTLAVAELNAEQAQACAGDAISCPLQFGPPVDTERAQFDFTLGADPIVFLIE